jgi:hypothetical protein
MTLDEARKIMDGWETRKAEDRPLVLKADKLLQEAWDRKKREKALRSQAGWPE